MEPGVSPFPRCPPNLHDSIYPHETIEIELTEDPNEMEFHPGPPTASFADELLSEWLKNLQFRVFPDEDTWAESDFDPVLLDEFFSWEFGKLDIGLQPAHSTSTLPVDDSPPPMETRILDELLSISARIVGGKIPIPSYWKTPNSDYTDPEDLEFREKSRVRLIKFLETNQFAIEWIEDINFFETIQGTSPNVTINEKDIHHYSTLYQVLVANSRHEPMQEGFGTELLAEPNILGLYKFPITTTLKNTRVPHPLPLGLSGFSTHPPVAMRMKLNWDINFAPLCFAGETKPSNAGSAKAQNRLASCLHPSINLLILYHLHHRTSPEEPFPPWMYIYGVVEDENGIEIYAHYPRMVFGPEQGVISSREPPPQYPHWGYGSILVTCPLQTSFKRDKRFKLLSALLTVQSHAHFLTKKFQNWKPEPEDMVALCLSAKSIAQVPADITPPAPNSPAPSAKYWSRT